MKRKIHSPRSRFCVPWSTFFDTAPYYSKERIELMKKVIKENGGFNIRMRNQFDWSNQPKVVTFSAGTGFLDDIKDALNKALKTEWVHVDNIANWKTKK